MALDIENINPFLYIIIVILGVLILLAGINSTGFFTVTDETEEKGYSFTENLRPLYSWTTNIDFTAFFGFGLYGLD